MLPSNAEGKTSSRAYLTPLGAWALSFGCSVGWGAFVMPGTTFLPVAGPVGTALGIALGGLVMLVLGLNYHYLMNRFAGSGGVYSYTKNTFGYDHGFISAWFMLLTYVAIIWANATALPLIARTVLGSTFQFGFDYVVAGYHIYFGEILLAVLSLVIAAFICLRRSLSQWVQGVMALVLLVGAAICFAAGMAKGGTGAMTPAFAPAHSPFGGVFTIFALAPWAFVGFESISHSAAEAKFPLKRTFPILAVSVVTATAAYIMLTLLAVTAMPNGIGSWPEYVEKMGEFSGTASQPAFFAAESALGTAGSVILCLAALGAIFTGLIGNYIAMSRLITSMSDDSLLPAWLGKREGDNVPRNAILAIMAVSAVLPFLGRTAISWIVDVTTVGATIAYAFASASAWKLARQEKKTGRSVLGILGVVISLLFALEFLIPNITSVKTLATESYLILAFWSILGFLYFRGILKKDKERHFGRSTVAWVILLGLIIFTSSVWMRQTTENAIENSIVPIQTYYTDLLARAGVDAVTAATKPSYAYLQETMEKINTSFGIAIIIQMALIVGALLILFDINARMQRREKQIEVEKALAEDASRAKTSFLSNMSHEIRTPMNAIIGLDNIALRNPDLQPQTREQLEKIGASARHLLGLINDILDMSRIESGRMVLKNEEFLFSDFLEQINIIINGQCQDKGLTYECTVTGPAADYYFGDDMKLKQVLINILGNSVKFTEAPGKVSLQVEPAGDGVIRFVVRDTGIGMDKEFIPKLFEAFSQEDATTTNRYGGSGLGMAITKNYVEMMNGTILVESEKGVGSTFTVTVPLVPSDRAAEKKGGPGEAEEETWAALAGRRVLIAEDVDQNAEILEDLLSLEDIECERACNGQEAVDMFAASAPGHYDAVLMDVRMPVMDGLGATEAIRALDRPDAKTVPILAMTANVFEDDIERSMQAGMNAHLSKPIEPEKLFAALARYISNR